MIFSSLDFAPEIQQALDACGYRQMTPIQEKAIIPARRGRNILASAQTGTGKTAAFALPVLQQMFDQAKPTIPGRPRALILTPTRELAEQVAETISRYAQFLSITITAIYGGAKMSAQESKLKTGIDIIVATPGRLMEHMVQGNVNLSNIEFVVLDEADRMLDMGFISDIESLLQKVTSKHQTLLFSATISQAVKQLASKLLHKHDVISVARQNAIADTIQHVVYPVEERRKAELLVELIDKHNWFQVLVFTSTKDQADKLINQLKPTKIKAAICHSDKSQGFRRRALADFKSAKIQVLIATEVAARGLDIQGLEHVVNYNLPYLAEDYVHRVGRTGRAGTKGQAISLVSREEERALANIERTINARVERINVPGYEVGSRETLFKNLAQRKRPPRKNKASQTRIIHNKNSSNKSIRKK